MSSVLFFTAYQRYQNLRVSEVSRGRNPRKEGLQETGQADEQTGSVLRGTFELISVCGGDEAESKFTILNVPLCCVDKEAVEASDSSHCLLCSASSGFSVVLCFNRTTSSSNVFSCN